MNDWNNIIDLIKTYKDFHIWYSDEWAFVSYKQSRVRINIGTPYNHVKAILDNLLKFNSL